METRVRCIIVDLDGTLCDHRHRLHFVDPSKNHEYFDATHSSEKCSAYECEQPEPFDWISRKTNEKFKPDYGAFYAAMDKDGVNDIILKIIQKMSSPDHPEKNIPFLIYLTGRPEKYRRETQYWLYKNDAWNEHHDKLFMRPDFLPIHRKDWIDSETGEKKVSYPSLCDLKEDHRPSAEVKREIYEREIRDKYEILFVLEDDSTCAEMYRTLGLQVLKVM